MRAESQGAQRGPGLGSRGQPRGVCGTVPCQCATALAHGHLVLMRGAAVPRSLAAPGGGEADV